MAYSDDAVNAKLASLNETQDSIVAVAQWIMFHRRHADRTAQIWLSRLEKEQNQKRLVLIYLANEVVQQSRARSKTDFLIAFEPLIADATAIAYRGASMELQQKLKRVVEVWNQRKIFDPVIQAQTEKKIEEIEGQRGASNGLGKSRLGGSLFGSGSGSVIPELDGITKALMAAGKAEMAVKSAVPSAESDYSKQLDPAADIPSPPVHAARLNSLLKSLASAQSAVEGCIKARQDIVAGLEKLLESHKSKLHSEQESMIALKSKSETVEGKKKEVEDHIMQGLTSEAATQLDSSTNDDLTRPVPESFTPPPPDVEAFTPPPQEDESVLIGDADNDEKLLSGPTGADILQEQPVERNEPPPANVPPLLQLGQTRQASSELPTQDPRLKRRKISHDVDEDIFGSGSLGVDEEGVSALLGN